MRIFLIIVILVLLDYLKVQQPNTILMITIVFGGAIGFIQDIKEITKK